jgi:hypothetical protein
LLLGANNVSGMGFGFAAVATVEFAGVASIAMMAGVV